MKIILFLSFIFFGCFGRAQVFVPKKKYISNQMSPDIPVNSEIIFEYEEVFNGKKTYIFNYTDPKTKKMYRTRYFADQVRKPGELNSYIQFYDEPRKPRANCETKIDLMEKLGPPRNQGPMGWCFAFALADYLSVRNGKIASALDVAIRSEIIKGESKSLSLITGGSALGMMQEVLKTGYCLEENLPSEAEIVKTPIYESLKEFEQFHENWKSTLRNQGNSKNCPDELRNNPIFRGLLKSGFQDFEKIFDQVGSFQAIKYVRDQSCKPPEKESGQSQIYLQNKRPIVDSIDDQLDLGQPTLVGIEGNQILEEKRDGDTGHAMNVIARRENPETHQCEYFLRNSWGSNCSSYRKDFLCDEAKGGIWVPRGELENIVNTSNFLRP